MVAFLHCHQGHRWKPINEGPASVEQHSCPECGSPASSASPTEGSASQVACNTVSFHASTTSPATAELPVVPGYEMRGVLGRGGMGVVYLAQQAKLKRPVALKMVLAGAHAGREELDRLRIEAEAAARLQHPNIVQIYEVGEQDGRPFLALEYVAGGSLSQRLAGTPLPPRQAAELAQILAGAMHYAHQRGVVHRDLKPANVLLSSEAVPKIADFGLAKQLDSDTSQTQTGQILGTPSYMAPEQAAGSLQQIGPLVDVYALGAILYEMLTGRPPFKAATIVETLDQVRSQEPVPPSQLQPRLSRDLETICLKCLRKEPRQRYTSAEALADDLGHYLAGEPIQARPVGTTERLARWCRRNPALATAGGLAVLTTAATLATLVVIVILVLGGRADALRFASEKGRLAEAERAQRVKAEREAAFLFFEQTYTKCSQEDCGAAVLHLAHALEKTSEVDVPDLHESIRLQLSAWGRQIHPLRHVLEHDGYVKAAYSPDGRLILTECSNLAQLWDATTGKQMGPPFEHEHKVTTASFSPDGQMVLTGSGTMTGRGEARLWRVDTQAAVAPPLPHESALRAVAFSPDGKSFATVCQESVQLWETSSQRPLGFPMDVASVDYLSFTPDGKQVLTWHARGPLQLWDLQTSECLNTLGESLFAWHPDGRKIATCGSGARGEGNRIVMWDLPTARIVGLPITARGILKALAFTPDGTALVTGEGDGKGQIWKLKTGGAVELSFAHRGLINRIAISPDGETVLTGSWDGTARLWDVRTGKVLGSPLCHAERIVNAAFSPDGKHVLTSSTDGTARLWEVRAATRPPFGGDRVRCLAFSPDGNVLLTGSFDGLARLWDVRTGEAIGAPMWHGAMVSSVAFSPDGKTVLTGCRNNDQPLWGALRFWDAASGRPQGPPHMQGQVEAVAFSPDGTVCLSAGWDGLRLWKAGSGEPLPLAVSSGTPQRDVVFSPDGQKLLTAFGIAQVWDLKTGRKVGLPLKHQDSIRRATFSPDGKRALTASDKSVQIWEADTGQPLGPPILFDGPVNAAVFSPDGRMILTANHVGVDRKGSYLPACDTRFWDARTGEPSGSALRHSQTVHAVAFSPDSQTVAMGTGRYLDGAGSVGVSESETGRRKSPRPSHDEAVRAIAFSPDGSRFVTCGEDGRAQVWDATTGKPLIPPFYHSDKVFAVAFSPDGTKIVTGSGNTEKQTGEARQWDVETGSALGLPLVHDKPVSAVAFYPDGQRVLTGTSNESPRQGEMQVWDAATGERLGPPLTQQLPSHVKNEIDAVRFHPDGKRFLSLTRTGLNAGAIALLWESETGKFVKQLARSQTEIKDAVFSPDGENVLIGNADGTAQLWSLETGQPSGPALPHSLSVDVVAFTPDGRILVTGSNHPVQLGRGGEIRCWDAASGKAIGPASPHPGHIYAIACAADNRTFLTASKDTAVRRWRIAPARGEPLHLIRQAQALIGRELDPKGAIRIQSPKSWQSARDGNVDSTRDSLNQEMREGWPED